MVDDELDGGTGDEEIEVFEDADAEKLFREVFTGVEEDSAAGGEFLTIGTEYLHFTDDPYSSKQDSERVIDEIAESIGKVGLLQPPVVVRSEHGYTVVAGRKRVKACKKLGLTEVTCVVRELDELQQQQATLIENLCRVVYEGPARDKARAELQKLYLVLHPETKPGMAGGFARANPSGERAPSFSKVMADKEGVSTSTIQTSVLRGNTFSDLDRETFVTHGIPTYWQTKLSRIDSEEDRNKILNMIRKGVPYKKAGKKVKPEAFGFSNVKDEDKVEGPENKKISAIKQLETTVALADSEWLSSFESVRTLVNTQLFDLHAILYRRTQDVLSDLRSVFGKYEKVNQIKGKCGTKGHFPAIVARFLKTPHPQEWQVCGECKGNGTIERTESDDKEDTGDVRCIHCGGTGFIIPPANVGYWIRLGIKGYGRD